MPLFYAAIRRDRVSLLWFSFHCDVQIFSCAISSVCCLKYTYSCFSSDFCFLVFVAFSYSNFSKSKFYRFYFNFSTKIANRFCAKKDVI